MRLIGKCLPVSFDKLSSSVKINDFFICLTGKVKQILPEKEHSNIS